MRFDINTLARIAFAQSDNILPKSLSKRDLLAENTIDNIESIIECIKDSIDFKEFSDSYIDLLKEVLSLAYIKNIDLNKYINISIPEDKKVIEKY